MAKTKKRIHKKRGPGRPKRPGGPDTVIPVRLPKKLIAGIDEFRASQPDKPLRSQVIRRLLEKALGITL
jgi:hypothetical protein